MHHAYFIEGDIEGGIVAAKEFAHREYALSGNDNPDLSLLSSAFFSIDDARKVGTLAYQTPLAHEKKCLIIAADRFSGEAQNALLKLFEEPPVSTVLILVVPYGGILLPTLRSRVIPLESKEKEVAPSPLFTTFIEASQPEKEKIVSQLIEKSKSDKEDVKQQARTDAVFLAESLMRYAYEHNTKKPNQEFFAFLQDMNRLLPLLHERSAPLKLIFEHILLTLPKK